MFFMSPSNSVTTKLYDSMNMCAVWVDVCIKLHADVMFNNNTLIHCELRNSDSSYVLPQCKLVNYDFVLRNALLLTITSDDWSVPSLLVASSNHILRLVPDAVGTTSYELLASYNEMVTSVAAISVERVVFFSTRAASTAFIARFCLLSPTNL